MTLLEIKTAIAEKLQQELAGTEFQSMPIICEDATENSIRPSLKIAVEKLKITKFNLSSKEKTFTVNVSFFAENMYSNKEHISQIQELMENALLGDIAVDGMIVPVSNLSSEIKEGTLKISFELYAVELMSDTEAGETMESLEFKEEVND